MSSFPIGSTTGLDQQDNPKIEEAGRWLASVPTDQRPRPIIPAVCERFGLTPKEACEAIRAAALAYARAL